jgi:FkbM family methyltransferase
MVEGQRYVKERVELLKLARPGQRVLEVGANIGYTMLLLARAAGDHGHVLCLEPVPENLHELRLNVEANDLTNVSILPVAAGDFDGRIRMRGGLNGRVERAGGDLEVEIRRIDSIEGPVPDLIKVDVEGFELSVLRGAVGLLRQGKNPSWWIEMHPQLVESSSELFEVVGLLEAHNYALSAYRPPLSSSLLEKVLERYVGIPTLDRTNDPREWLRESDEGGRNDSFWLSATIRR